MSANLYELLSKPFQEFSGSVAIDCHERGVWTYGELEEQTARYADWLIGSGVKPGDRVVVQAEKSPEVVFLYLASLKSGAIFLPLNTAYQPAELEFFLSDAEPRIFVCDPKKQTTLNRSVRQKASRFSPLAPTVGETFRKCFRNPEVNLLYQGSLMTWPPCFIPRERPAVPRVQ